MQFSIPLPNRYKLAERIGMFMATMPLPIQRYGVAQAYMSKAEQIEAFGFYLGEGLIEVHSEYCSITIRKTIGSGDKLLGVQSLSALTGWAYLDEDNNGPVYELNLCSPLKPLSGNASIVC